MTSAHVTMKNVGGDVRRGLLLSRTAGIVGMGENVKKRNHTLGLSSPGSEAGNKDRKETL